MNTTTQLPKARYHSKEGVIVVDYKDIKGNFYVSHTDLYLSLADEKSLYFYVTGVMKDDINFLRAALLINNFDLTII